MRKSLLFTLLASALPSHAAQVIWLEWTGAGGAAGLTGAFPTGGATGSVSATRTGAIDGAANGVPGPLAGSLTSLTPTFNSFYGTGNPGTGLANLAQNYNDTGDRYNVTLDFTSLANGVLEAGSWFAFVDYDISESLQDLTAFTLGGSMVTSAWLASIGGAGAYIDASSLGGDSSGSMPVPAPNMTLAGGVYQVTGAAGNMDSGLYVFRTTVPITTISYQHFVTNGLPARVGGGGGAIAIGSEAPEPSAWGLAAAGLGLLSLRLRRRGTQATGRNIETR